MAQTAVFTIDEALRQGWALTKPNLFKLWGWGATMLLVSIGFNIIQAWTDGGVSLLVGLASYIVSLTLSVSLLKITLRLAHGQTPKYGELFWFEGKVIWYYFVASILYSAIILLGIVLLIIPAIIWGLMFGQFQYVVAERGVKPREALKLSRQMTNGNKGKLLWLGLAVGLINLGGALLLGIGLLVTIPWSTMVSVWVYRRMSSMAVPAAVPETV